MIFYKVLQDKIEQEKAGLDYMCPEIDKQVLSELFKDINKCTGIPVQYLAEIDAFNLSGAGSIMAEYMSEISSQSVKCFLIPQIVEDKVTDCDKLLLSEYLSFKSSEEYISPPGKSAPAYIYVRFDNAFRRLKSKRIADELVDIVLSPRDAYYLPFTVRMLAAWKKAELKNALFRYALANCVSIQEIGIPEDGKTYFPSYPVICRELRFTAINALKYYPCDETSNILEICMEDTDIDISNAARKVKARIERM